MLIVDALFHDMNVYAPEILCDNVLVIVSIL